MVEPIPFSITREAADYVRSRLEMLPTGEEPVLVMAENQGYPVDTRGEKIRWWYEGENFIIGYYLPDERPSGDHVDILGYRVWVTHDALKQLSGRTLTLRPVVVRHGWFWKETKHVLVAA